MSSSRPATAATARRLTRQHFALYRGWLEGAAIEGLHAAYGDPGSDVRVTRRLLATLRDTLAVAARRARPRSRAPAAPEARQHPAGRAARA